MTAGVRIEGLTRRFAGQTALDGVSLEIGAGEFAVLLGPSGCGKTTLLNILGGFLDPDAGRVAIGGRDVTALAPQRRPTATVFQDYALFPHMTLGENVAFGLRMRGQRRRARRARAEEMLALVGLEGQAGKRPAELSGGQRQRVALARALAVGPEVLLLDEPLGALDLKLRRQMQEELVRLQREVGTTFVHVTHDQEEAMAMADRIVVMNAGRIEDEGPPERVYRRPASRFAAEFMGEINILTGRTGVPKGETLTVGTALGPLPVQVGARRFPTSVAVKLGIRPEAFREPGPGAVPVRLTVAEASFFGTHTRIAAIPASGGRPILAHLPPEAEPRPGEEIELRLDPARIVLLPGGHPPETDPETGGPVGAHPP